MAHERPSEQRRGERKDAFLTVLAVISFVADFLTLTQFVGNVTILSFWTFRWFMSILLIALLGVAGFGLLVLAGRTESAKTMMLPFGALYTIASLILYMYFAYKQSLDGVPVGDYFGFLILLLMTGGVGLGCIGSQGLDLLRYPSYGLAVANLLHVFLLVYKYVFGGAPFTFWQFVGEMVILGLGVSVFLFAYIGPESLEDEGDES